MHKKPVPTIYILSASLIFVLGGLFAWQGGWTQQAKDWLHLLVRWAHVIYGIAWVGASFYFIFLENSLERKGVRDELAGNLWAIHGGGVYYLEKYKTAPKELPKTLHWFKWDAYLTWVTGFLLLVLVYYSNPQATLIDPSVRALSSAAAIAIAVGSLVTAWGVYVGLSRTRLLYHQGAFGLVGLVLVALAAYLLAHLFSGRGAFIHVGAMLGTIMAGNVLFVIIPSQRRLVAAAQKGAQLDPNQVKYTQLRSLHNNYLALPVVYTMVSNHFPMTYAPGLNWAILAGLFVASVAIRHFTNVRERGGDVSYLLPVAALIILVVAYVSVPPRKTASSAPVSFAEAESIIRQRCASCHSANPSDTTFVTAPAGAKLDSPQQMAALAPRILERAVLSRDMPLANKTGMTDEERDILRRWIQQGAKIN